LKRSLAFVLAVCAAPVGADWPQWRGPQRDGKTAGLAERASWPKSLVQGWRVEVGVGHSSPVVAGGIVYQFARQGEQEALAAFDLKSGRALWRQAYDAPYSMNMAARSHGKGPKSTPAVADGRVFALGISGILSAWDAAGGRLLWRHDVASRFARTSPLYGAAMSPVVAEGLVVAHLGGHDDGALEAYEAATGKPRWSWKADGPGYASPVVAELGGVAQLVTQTQTRLASVALADGKLLWSVPLTTSYDQNSVTPIVRDGVVYYSGLDKGVHALRVVRRGAEWVTAPAWDTPELAFYMSTPVLDGAVLYGFAHQKKGQFVAIDATNGRLLWASDGRQGDNAAVVAAGGALLLLNDDAVLTVAKPGRARFEVLASYTVAPSPTWAHAVPTEAGILVKDLETLTLWRFE
jgi:outer membrane protein assembly factor BamB